MVDDAAPTHQNFREPTRHRHDVRQADTVPCRRHGLCRVGNMAPTCRHVCCFGGENSRHDADIASQEKRLSTCQQAIFFQALAVGRLPAAVARWPELRLVSFCYMRAGASLLAALEWSAAAAAGKGGPYWKGGWLQGVMRGGFYPNFGSFNLNSYVERSIQFCIYVDDTKCELTP
jgi:hypothetical protein